MELRVNEGGGGFGLGDPIPRLVTDKGVYTLRTSSTNTEWVVEAAAAGKADEVRAMLERHPPLAKEPNKDGIYPLHVASSPGSDGKLLFFYMQHSADHARKEPRNHVQLQRKTKY